MLHLEGQKTNTVINTVCDPDDTTTVRRKNSDGSRVEITFPASVRAYNAYMGGVDLADKKQNQYTCTKKIQNVFKFPF